MAVVSHEVSPQLARQCGSQEKQQVQASGSNLQVLLNKVRTLGSKSSLKRQAKGQARSSHRLEGSNELPPPPPPLFAKFRFFSCSLYERALSCHHTRSLQLKQRKLVERDVDCQRVHDSRAVGVGTTSTEV